MKPIQRRVLKFGPVENVCFVSDHCIQRFKERCRPDLSDEQCILKLQRWLRKSREVTHDPSHEVLKIKNNYRRKARYFLKGLLGPNNGVILVVDGDTLVTVYKNKNVKLKLIGGKYKFHRGDFTLEFMADKKVNNFNIRCLRVYREGVDITERMDKNGELWAAIKKTCCQLCENEKFN